MSNMTLYRSIVTGKDYLMVHRALVQELNASRAVFLTELARKEDALINSNKLPEDGWFYFLTTEITKNTGFSSDQITAYWQELKKRGLIDVQSRSVGDGKRNFYCINYEKIMEILIGVTEKVGQGCPEKSVMGDRESRTGGDRKSPTIIRDERDNEMRETMRQLQSNCRDAEASPSPDVNKSPVRKRRDLRKDVSEIIREAIPLGEFNSRPPEEGKVPLQWHLDVQKFLTLLPDPRALQRAYEFDPEWVRRSGIDFDHFKDCRVESLVRRAAKRFATMRREGYAPEKKSILTHYLQEFFYNRVTHRSWFLYCTFNEPRSVTGGRVSTVVLSEEETEMILSHNRRGWNEEDFLSKAKSLLAWYRGSREDVMTYNYHVLDKAAMWSEHCGTFARLLDTIDEFSQTWKSWTLGNFGHGNRTWTLFVEWCLEQYGIDLEISDAKVRRAREAREQHNQRVQEMEAELRERDPGDVSVQAAAFREEFLGSK